MIFGSIAGILQNGLQLAANWVGKYAGKENEAAREINVENKKMDKMNEAISQNDITTERINLS